MKSRPVHQVDSHLQFQDEFKKFQEYQGEWMIVPGPSIHFKKNLLSPTCPEIMGFDPLLYPVRLKT